MRKSLLIGFLLMLAYTALMAVACFSWGYTGSLSEDGIAVAGSRLFGGLPSLGGALLGIMVFAVVVFIIYGLAKNNQNGAAAAVAAVAIIIASFGIARAMTMPSDQIGAFIVLLLVSAVMTGLMWKILVPRTSSSSASTSTSATLWEKFQAKRRARAARIANGHTTATTP